MNISILFLLLIYSFSAFSFFGGVSKGDKFICRFENGRYEGEIKEITRDGFMGKKTYTFESTHIIRLDHRIRLKRNPLSQSARFTKSIDEEFLKKNCDLANKDDSLITSLMGLGGFYVGDNVDCDGIRSVVEELRENDVLLLENDYLFYLKDCSKMEEVEQADTAINDAARGTGEDSDAGIRTGTNRSRSQAE